MAILTPTRPPKYLHAATWRCSPLCAHPRDHHSLCLLLLTGLGCHPHTSPPEPDPHDTATSAIYTGALTTAKLSSRSSRGGARRFAHIRVAAGAPSRPLVPTNLGCHPHASPPEPDSHDTATSAILALSRPPNYLPETPGGARRFAHLCVAGTPSRPLVPTDLGCRPHASPPETDPHDHMAALTCVTGGLRHHSNYNNGFLPLPYAQPSTAETTWEVCGGSVQGVGGCDCDRRPVRGLKGRSAGLR
jgi:hypothetical protein